MTRNINIAPGEFYHIYNRGTEKRNIFLRKQDYDRFLSLLYLANGSKSVDLKRQGSTLSEIMAINKGVSTVHICGYCLMPNHFHLIIKELESGGISRFMQKLTTGYTMYFNKLYERNGALFQGRFKARHINDDTYLKYLISYVHLNPIKLIDPQWKENGIKDSKWSETFLNNYKYSSFLDYTREESRPETKIIEMTALPEYYESAKDFEKNVAEWLRYKNNEK